MDWWWNDQINRGSTTLTILVGKNKATIWFVVISVTNKQSIFLSKIKSSMLKDLFDREQTFKSAIMNELRD